MPYRAMRVTKNTPIRRRGFDTWRTTLKTTTPTTRVVIARTEVMNIPPIAIPPRRAIRDIGAIMYSCRLPISFSQ